jgi:hypothetical protein
VAVGFLCVTAWLILGANRGWTKTTRTEMKKDPVTELEYPVVENHFTPGVEMLGAGLLLALALAGISFAFKPKPKH